MIPRILHRVWIGGEKFPESYREYGDLWKELHPGWEIKLWTDENRPRLENEDLYEKTGIPAHQADLLRLEILRREGGVYSDCDVIPLRSCEKFLLLPGFSGALLGRARPENATNAFLGAEKEAVWIGDAIRFFRRHFSERFIEDRSWNKHLSEALKRHPGIAILPGKSLWPVHPEDVARLGADSACDRARRMNGYLVHLYAGSWVTR